MSLNFSTSNWETIATGWKFYSLLIFFLVIVFKKPISDRLNIFLHRGYEKKKERSDRINVARNVVSFRKSNSPTAYNGDLTDENGYLAIRRHLTPFAREFIESPNKYFDENDRFSSLYEHGHDERLRTLALELDRLSKKWRLPV